MHQLYQWEAIFFKTILSNYGQFVYSRQILIWPWKCFTLKSTLQVSLHLALLFQPPRPVLSLSSQNLGKTLQFAFSVFLLSELFFLFTHNRRRIKKNNQPTHNHIQLLCDSPAPLHHQEASFLAMMVPSHPPSGPSAGSGYILISV